MQPHPAYEEIVDFIASGPSRAKVIAFRASSASRERVSELVRREKEGALSAEETSELAHYIQLEHLMRLAKARAKEQGGP